MRGTTHWAGVDPVQCGVLLVRAALLGVRCRGGLPLSLGRGFQGSGAGGGDRGLSLPGGAHRRPGVRMEEGGVGMGVIIGKLPARIEKIPGGSILIGSFDAVINWSRANSLW